MPGNRAVYRVIRYKTANPVHPVCAGRERFVPVVPLYRVAEKSTRNARVRVRACMRARIAKTIKIRYTRYSVHFVRLTRGFRVYRVVENVPGIRYTQVETFSGSKKGVLR